MLPDVGPLRCRRLSGARAALTGPSSAGVETIRAPHLINGVVKGRRGNGLP